MSKPEVAKKARTVFIRIGPGIITACVVIGPGSVLTSTTVGAKYGFRLTWVLLIAVFLMMVYMTMGARLGVVANGTPGDIVGRKIGRWLTLLIGISVFCISGSYQFGNSLGVHSAISQVTQIGAESESAPPNQADSAVSSGNTESSESESDSGPAGRPMIFWVNLGLLIGFNLLAIAFLFAFRDLYRWLERLMMCFVGLMLGAFLINLIYSRPDLGEMVSGFVPSLPTSGDKPEWISIPQWIKMTFFESSENGSQPDWIPILGWIGTTFITAIAYYQAYLVRQKGWTAKDLKDGMIDARIGSVILAVITWMIMATAASVFFSRSIQPEDVGDVAQQLKPFFGTTGQVVFCVGLFCAAYSSFLINSMVGGFLFVDGLGYGSDPRNLAPRLGAAAIMLTGMLVAIAIICWEIPVVPAIVFAQAVTVIAAPLIGGVLWWLTSSSEVMGDQKNGIFTNIIAAFGFLMLLCFSGYLVVFKILPKLQELLGIG